MKHFRIRLLADGRYVAERRSCLFFWTGIDIRTQGYHWLSGSTFYRDCIGTFNECKEACAKDGASAEDICYF